MTLDRTGPSGGASAIERGLLSAIKQRLDNIEGLLDGFAEAEEEGVYRYYHQSLKVYGMQDAVRAAQRLFDELAPDGSHLNAWFVSICEVTCEHQFDFDRSNKNWQAETRPILEGFWHCSYFLRMLVGYGRELDQPADGAAVRVGGRLVLVRHTLSAAPRSTFPSQPGDRRRRGTVAGSGLDGLSRGRDGVGDALRAGTPLPRSAGARSLPKSSSAGSAQLV